MLDISNLMNHLKKINPEIYDILINQPNIKQISL